MFVITIEYDSRETLSGHSGCCLSKTVQLLCISHVISQQTLLAKAILVYNVSGEHEEDVSVQAMTAPSTFAQQAD